jgi:guanine deaminase
MNEAFMREALRLARENVEQAAGGPFGAVVVKDGRIVGRGSNRVTTTLDPTAHAEIVAIREACQGLGTFVLAGCHLYTSCEPCPMCLSAAYWARIERLFYAGTRADAAAAGFDDDFLYREVARPIAERTLVSEPLLREEAAAVFALWQASPDRIPY